jgi:hypothetical protein
MTRDTALNAWGKGIGAACEGAQLTENPYPADTKLAEVWVKGWARVEQIRHVLPTCKLRKP